MLKSLKITFLISLFALPVAAQDKPVNLDALKDALNLFRGEKLDKAEVKFKELLQTPGHLEEYIRFYLGSVYLKQKKWGDAESEFTKVLNLSPNAKMSIEASNLLGQVSLAKNDFKLARTYFIKLEKRTRNSEDYPSVIYNLAVAENGLKKHGSACIWLRKIYERYPNFEHSKNWGHDLSKNEFLGKPSDCMASSESFRTRVRYLLWAGLDQKAQGEINAMKSKLANDDKYLTDKLQAQFYLQEGEVQKAVEILKPYYESHKRNFDYLMTFGSASARAGEVQLAVGSYYNAYKLSPRSKTGRQALYQSAFLSYQFQDYDGATRRFTEFMKAYPQSGLARDAQWQLAWLKYLKGDYVGAYKDLGAINNNKKYRRWKSFPQDRVRYWMAMSLFKQGKYEQAKIYFEGLSKDPLKGYYSIAAEARLAKLAKLIKPESKARSLPTRPTLSRFSSTEFLMPSTDLAFNYDYDNTVPMEEESEENFVVTQYSMDEEKEELENESEGEQDNPDLKHIAVGNFTIDQVLEGTDKVSSPLLLRRFERARDMIILGEMDWARWDLYDIETKTRNKTHLRVLLNEYTNAGHYNRSAYIAQINFSSIRAEMGIEGVRYFWEHAYPRAYDEYVTKYSKKFSVPEDMIWGIMRAETNYRRDAISPVGALGLMQVMPVTGYRVASLIGDNSFKSSMLLEPDTAVKIGSRYLKRLMDRFEGNLPLVAGGYNAGPHRVDNWLVSFGNLDMDEFIDHIPFLETRNYVKRVVSNAYIYSQLYGEKTPMKFSYLSEVIGVKGKAEHSGKENWDDI